LSPNIGICILKVYNEGWHGITVNLYQFKGYLISAPTSI
jgi:hypothetical protein